MRTQGFGRILQKVGGMLGGGSRSRGRRPTRRTTSSRGRGGIGGILRKVLG